MNVLIAKNREECAGWTDVAVVVDVLRASSTVAALVQRSKKKVVLTDDPTKALVYKKAHPEYEIFSELAFPKGVEVTDNSPYLASKTSSSKPALVVTAAGTPALLSLKNASRVFMGGFCNFLPLIKLLQVQKKDVLLVPAALFGNQEDSEDFLCVEAIKDYLQGFDTVYEKAEEFKVTLRRHEFLHGPKTADKDVQIAFEINSIPFVPVVDLLPGGDYALATKFDKLVEKEKAVENFDVAPDLGQTLVPIGVNVDQTLGEPENTVFVRPKHPVKTEPAPRAVAPEEPLSELNAVPERPLPEMKAVPVRVEADDAQEKQPAPQRKDPKEDTRVSTKSGLGNFFKKIFGGKEEAAGEITGLQPVEPDFAVGEMDRIGPAPVETEPTPPAPQTAFAEPVAQALQPALEPEPEQVLDIKEETLRPGVSDPSELQDAMATLRVRAKMPEEEDILSVRLSAAEPEQGPAAVTEPTSSVFPAEPAPRFGIADETASLKTAAPQVVPTTPPAAQPAAVSVPPVAAQPPTALQQPAAVAEPAPEELGQTVSFGVKKRKKAIVLFSGGLDSTTCLYWALAKGYECETLTVSYGQKHDREVRAAAEIAKRLGVKHTLINLAFPWLASSSLVDKNQSIPDQPIEQIESGHIPSTYVPGRNLVFLSVAASLLDAVHADAIVAGPNAIDFSGYPDCMPDFFKAAAAAINLGTERGVRDGVEVLAPLMRLNKSQIVQLGARLHVPFELTWSCYAGGDRPCGHCDSCKLRAKGFAEAGVKDGGVEVN